jgi:hypothetical protein
MNIETFGAERTYEFPRLKIIDPEPVFSESQHVGLEAGQACILFEAHKDEIERQAFMKYLEFSTELM